MTASCRGTQGDVNAKVMKDPRMRMPDTPMPFDLKRMSYGGFEVVVDLTQDPVLRSSSERHV